MSVTRRRLAFSLQQSSELIGDCHFLLAVPGLRKLSFVSFVCQRDGAGLGCRGAFLELDEISLEGLRALPELIEAALGLSDALALLSKQGVKALDSSGLFRKLPPERVLPLLGLL